MSLTAREIAELTGGALTGDGDLRVNAVAPSSSAGPNDLTFVQDEKELHATLASTAGVVIAGRFATGAGRAAGALVVCDRPRLAFALAGRRVCPPDRPPAGTHPAATVDPSASLGAGVAVGPHAVIEADARIGDRVVVGAGCYVGRGVVVGDDCVLEPNVVIYPATTLGARVIVHAGTVLGSDGFGYVRDPATGRYEPFPQVGRLVVEDDVEFGAQCAVDRGALGETRIKRGAKLDNLVHVAHNVSIGEDVVVAGQSGFGGSAVVEDDVMIAGQVGVADHALVERGVILGGQCGVPSGDVVRGPGEAFLGSPARPLKQVYKEMAALARLARK
jgi:UDP-3-O-[3-hydroxymyristoyl] glucosamine N-acyltransferase